MSLWRHSSVIRVYSSENIANSCIVIPITTIHVRDTTSVERCRFFLLFRDPHRQKIGARPVVTPPVRWPDPGLQLLSEGLKASSPGWVV